MRPDDRRAIRGYRVTFPHEMREAWHLAKLLLRLGRLNPSALHRVRLFAESVLFVQLSNELDEAAKAAVEPGA